MSNSKAGCDHEHCRTEHLSLPDVLEAGLAKHAVTVQLT